MTVQIVACLNLFSDKRTVTHCLPGTTLIQAAQLVGLENLNNARAFVNGTPGIPDQVLFAGDKVTLRVVPGAFAIQGGGAGVKQQGTGFGPPVGGYSSGPSAPQQGTPWGPIAGYALGALGLGASLLLNFSGRSKQGATANDIGSSIVQAPYDDSPTQLEAANTQPLLGLITGTSNQRNQYGRFPNAYGKGEFAPPIACDEQSEIQGNTQVATIAYDLGYGPLNITKQTINDRPLAEINAVNELHVGIPGETPFTLLTKDASEQYPNLLLEFGVDNTIETAQDGTRIGLDVQFDGGLYKNVITVVNEVQRPSRIAASVSLAAYYRPATSDDPDDYVLGTAVTVNELQTSAFRRGMYFDVPRGVYTVKVVRFSAPGGQDTQDAVTLIKVQVKDNNTNAFNDIKASNGDVINLARSIVQITQSDQLQGSLGQYRVAYERKLKHWNGSTWDDAAVTENPADIFCDILKGEHNRYPKTDDRLDLEKILEWWQYCQDRGLKFSKVFDSAITPLEALRQVCFVGRARLVYRDGKYSVFIDRPQTQIVQHFTPRNSWGFSWKATYGGTTDLLKIRFVNPEANYQADERFVFNDGKDITNYETQETLEVPGLQDKDQAWKLGRFVMADDQARRRVYQWHADFEAMVCQQGDLVVVSNPLIGAGLAFGRIKSLVTNGGGDILGFTFDSRAPQETGKSYKVRIRRSNGETLSKPVQTLVDGKTNALTFDTPILAAETNPPAVGDLVMYGEDPESRELVITNIVWDEDMTATITAVDHAPGIYESDTQPIPPFTAYIQGYHPTIAPVPVPVIWSYQSDESVLDRDIDGALRTRVVLNMQPMSSDIAALEVSVRRVGQTQWGSIQDFKVVGGPLSIYGLQDGVSYDFRVRARNKRNRISPWNESLANYRVIGMTTPPADIPIITIDQDGMARAFYDAAHGVTVAPDFAGIVWKMHRGHNTNWGTAEQLTPVTGSTVFDFGPYARGLKTLMAKAVDVAGNESVNAAFLVLDYGDVTIKNNVHTETYTPDQTIITNGTPSGLTIIANDQSKYWSGSVNRFWKGIPSDLYWDSSYQELIVQWEYTAKPSLIRKPFTLLAQATVQAQSYRIEYRTFGQSNFWDNSPQGPNKPFWKGGTMWSQPSPWLPMLETGIPGTYGRVQYRIVCAASRYRSVVSDIVVIADAPDVVEYLRDVVVPSSAGVRLPITADKFAEIQYCSANLLYDVSYPDANSVEIVDTALTGPLVKIRDAAGAYTSGKVSAEVRGI